IHSLQRADGTKDSYVYQHGNLSGTAFTPNSAGAATRIAIIHGTTSTGAGISSYPSFVLPAGSPSYNIEPLNLVANKSTLATFIRDAYAHLVRTETWVWDGAAWQPVTSKDF